MFHHSSRSSARFLVMEMNSTISSVLDTIQAASQVGLSVSTLAKLRSRGDGPAYCKLGRRVVYRPEDLAAWLDEHRRLSTSHLGETAC
jgi:predicted DNA-binding transcriptional regulator AlpA